MSLDLATRAKEIIGRYPSGRGRSALLPLLHLVQDRDGYVTEQGMRDVAEILGLTAAEVNSVATFYSMYHLRPKGRHVVSVCHNLACSLAGAERLISCFEETLGARVGETTANGGVTLERVECLAACDLAPMIQIDYDEMTGPIRIDDVPSIVKDMDAGSDETRIDRTPVVVSTLHEVASQPVIESEPRGTSSPERALDPHHDLNPYRDLDPQQEVTSDEELIDEEILPEPPREQPIPVASDEDFVEEDFVREPEQEPEPEPDPTDVAPEESAEQGDPPPLIDSITISEEDEELLRDSTARRGQERRKHAAERLLEEPTYDGGVGPGPQDPKDLGAPLPPPSEEPEAPIRPRGAE